MKIRSVRPRTESQSEGAGGRMHGSAKHHHDGQGRHHHGHHHHGHGHGHTHGVVDATIASTSRGIWAIKWSFIGLMVTALIQVFVVAMSGSVALLADTIHNFGDAVTAVPLWIAFLFARRKPSPRFPYGLGKVEDIAGAVIVLIILFSAIVAAYESVLRFIHPQPIQYLGGVVVASIVGFIGNEAVALFRIRVGREINSVALIADGYHARVDGWTSLAVLAGAVGVWLGFPLADPLIGLGISAAIFGIVWQSARAVTIRALDGIEPETLAEIEHAAKHVPGVRGVGDVRARWLGHKLRAEVGVVLDPSISVEEASRVVHGVQNELHAHLPHLAGVVVYLAERSRENE